MKNQDSYGRLQRDRFGSRTSDYGTIYYLTDMDMSTLQKEVLCRGVDFGIPPPNISEPDILAEFEILQRQTAQLCPTSKEAAERSRCELAAAARESAGTKADTRDFSLQREHRKVLKDLR